MHTSGSRNNLLIEEKVDSSKGKAVANVNFETLKQDFNVDEFRNALFSSKDLKEKIFIAREADLLKPEAHLVTLKSKINSNEKIELDKDTKFWLKQITDYYELSPCPSCSDKILTDLFLYYQFLEICYNDKRLRADFDSRSLELYRNYAGLFQGLFLLDGRKLTCNETTHQLELTPVNNESKKETNLELQEYNALAAPFGWLISFIVMNVARPFYPNKKSMDPLYRLAKLWASIGQMVGSIVGFTWPWAIGQKISVAIFGTLGGITGIILAPIYYGGKIVYEKYFGKIDKKKSTKDENSIFQVCIEGVTKWGKTVAVFGSMIGGFAFGSYYAYIGSYDQIATAVTYGGMCCGVGFFAIALVAVPLINHFFNNILASKKEKPWKKIYRNNHSRLGITYGQSLLAMIGCFVGAFIFPGLGPMGGLSLFGALGGVVGGAYFTFKGPTHDQTIHGDNDTDNPWHFSARIAGIVFAFLGTAIGCCFYSSQDNGSPAASGVSVAAFFLGPALGCMVGTFVGCSLGFFISYYSRVVLKLPEEKHTELPYTQRQGNGVTYGNIIGGLAGLSIGLGLGVGLIPLSMLILQVASISGFAGGIYETFSDPATRKAWKTGWNKFLNPEYQPTPPDKTTQKNTHALLKEIFPNVDETNRPKIASSDASEELTILSKSMTPTSSRVLSLWKQPTLSPNSAKKASSPRAVNGLC